MTESRKVSGALIEFVDGEEPEPAVILMVESVGIVLTGDA
jgi:hypothetical protein